MGSEEGPDRLFAPWRFPYVSKSESTPECIFCAAARREPESLTLVVGRRAFALLNRFPYTSGHAMVAPVDHTADFAGLDEETVTEMMALAQRVMTALRAVYHPHGFNVGMNLGEMAGAGIVDHLHLHIVPRWRGDTNFMTATANVRVIPEGLDEALAKVRAALEGEAL